MSKNRREEDRKNGMVRKTALETVMDWGAAHKAASAGGVCVAGVGSTVAYKLSRPGAKPMEEIVRACKKCAPFTVLALAGAGLLLCYQTGSGSRAYQYAKQYVSSDANSPKELEQTRRQFSDAAVAFFIQVLDRTVIFS